MGMVFVWSVVGLDGLAMGGTRVKLCREAFRVSMIARTNFRDDLRSRNHSEHVLSNIHQRQTKSTKLE